MVNYIFKLSAGEEHIIKKHFLEQNPECAKLIHHADSDGVILLPTVDKATVGKFVLYLETGVYPAPTVVEVLRSGNLRYEFRNAMAIYCAARNLKLERLEGKAREVVVQISQQLSSPEVVKILENLYTSLPESDGWLNDFLEQKIASTFGHVKL